MKATINWMEGWANPPKLEVEIDRMPNNGEYVYEQRGTCYFAVLEDTSLVSFFHYESPGRGYGGRTFDLEMTDGTTKELIGPWSSRCAIMNEVGFPHSTEVVFITPDGHRFSGALLIEKAKELLHAANDGAIFVYDPEGHDYEIEKF